MMTINFNSKDHSIVTGINLGQFLSQQGIVDGKFVVVINNTIIPKSKYGCEVLVEGDVLEIVSPIAGG